MQARLQGTHIASPGVLLTALSAWTADGCFPDTYHFRIVAVALLSMRTSALALSEVFGQVEGQFENLAWLIRLVRIFHHGLDIFGDDHHVTEKQTKGDESQHAAS